MPRQRDNQRQRVYNWELGYLAKLANNKALSLDECKSLIQKTCLRYNKAIPHIKDGRGTQVARGGANLINLPRHARVTMEVLHEAAHSILIAKGDRTLAWHGPEFVRLFIELMAWQKLASIADLRASARRYKVKIAFAAAGPKPNSWKRGLGDSISKLVETYCDRFNLRPFEVRSAMRDVLSRR